jgi:hypothetical protein
VSYYQQFSINPTTGVRELTETLHMTSRKFAEYEINDAEDDDDDDD